MGKILIEKYRGFEIEFDTHYEKFKCNCNNEEKKESKSFSVIKKFIDDYLKNNQSFKPFWVCPNPQKNFYSDKLEVIAILKDGTFFAKDKYGIKTHILNHNMPYYILEYPENNDLMEKLEELRIKAALQEEENANARNSIASQMRITTLLDFKKQLHG